jgi:hypothetical protein
MKIIHFDALKSEKIFFFLIFENLSTDWIHDSKSIKFSQSIYCVSPYFYDSNSLINSQK